MDIRPADLVDRSPNSLAFLRLEGQTLDDLVRSVGEIAVETLHGWDAAATTLRTGNDVATYGATDERVRSVNQRQSDSGNGPSVDALRTAEMQYFDGTTIPAPWRLFAEIAADHQVYSVLSVPLMIDGDSVGAISFYSSERGALRPGHREKGALFAAQASVVVANARAFLEKDAQVAQLKEALETRTMIGQATGLLMAQEGLSSDEAFNKLVGISQNTNIKLREIAHRYVETWLEKTPARKLEA